MGPRPPGWLVRAQVRRPIPFLLGALALLVASGSLAATLGVRTEFERLLPARQPSVVELQRLRDRLGHGTAIFAVLEGDEPGRLREAGEAVRASLVARRPTWLVDASTGVHEARSFLRARAGLFADRAALVALRDDLEEARRAAVIQAAGLGLGLEEPRPPITADEVARRLVPREALAALGERWPGGWYQSEDGRALVVLVRTSIAPGDLDAARRALQEVKAAVSGVAIAGVRATYAGDLVTGLAEYGAVRSDLVSVGATGIALVLGVILLFFLRLRALTVLGAAIALGLTLTFGVARLAIGHLTVATSFLVSVVAGNGINAGIILLARYFEARKDGASAEEAIETAARATWLPTFGAAAAASAAYASLAVTTFLGLRHLAVIGGAGMLLCWAATYLVVPPLLAALERQRPLRFGARHEGRWRAALRRAGGRYGAPLVSLVVRAPLALALASALLTAGSAGLAVRWLRSVPVEYDMRRLGSDAGSAELARAGALARQVLGVNLESSMVVLVDHVDQVLPLKRALEARREAAPRGARPFEAVHTLLDFVAPDQEGKIPVLADVARLARTFRARGAIPDADWARLSPLLPPRGGLRPYRVEDLPEELARRFTERDGSRGRLLFVEPTAGEREDDLRYLLRFADAFRETRLPSGATIHGSGRAVLFADMLRAVSADMPRALLLSFLCTLGAVLMTFRRGRLTALVVGALVAGVAWLLALLDLTALKLNFLNFVALPVTFGIGVDYALNVVQRYGSGESVQDTLRRTGTAVTLCSLTTILGYLALLGSINQGVRSLGAVAVLGELCCLAVALVSLPAVLLLREPRVRP